MVFTSYFTLVIYGLSLRFFICRVINILDSCTAGILLLIPVKPVQINMYQIAQSFIPIDCLQILIGFPLIGRIYSAGQKFHTYKSEFL